MELDQENLTIEQAKALDKITSNFYCPLQANVYDIFFQSFKIRNLQNNEQLFYVDNTSAGQEDIDWSSLSAEEEQELRTIKYTFNQHFFDTKEVGTTLEFSIGDQAVKNFVMVEKHFIGNKMIRQYEFKFPFCIPNSTNTWESMYEMPAISQEDKELCINNPYIQQSDSFYFVDNKLVMHNKAMYKYTK